MAGPRIELGMAVPKTAALPLSPKIVFDISQKKLYIVFDKILQ